MNQLNDAKNLIEKSQNICLLPSKNIHGDVLGATLALFNALKKMGKNVDMLAKEIPTNLQFLNNSTKNSVISINISEKQAKKIYYEKNERNIKIYLNCEKEPIKKSDISFARLEKNYLLEFTNDENKALSQKDIFITIGAKSLEDLPISGQGIELFYKNPVLNIDNQLSNENFGEINLVNLTSSLSETSTEIIKSINETIIDKDIATQLLTGVLYFSQNLKRPKTRPITFEAASYLIEKKADHQKIIQHLYKTNSISKIKLLGRSLEKLNFNKEKNLYQIILDREDFQNSGTTSKDLSFIINELKLNFWIPCFPESNFLILWEEYSPTNNLKGILYSSKTYYFKTILKNFEGTSQGNRVLFSINKNNLRLAQEEILNILR